MSNTPNKTFIYISALITALLAYLFRMLTVPGSFPVYLEQKLNCSYQEYSFLAAAFMFFVLALFFKHVRNFIRGRADAVVAGMILGGGAFHAMERLMTGCVIDYFNFAGLYFNISDVLITLSTMYFAFIVLELNR